MRIVVTILTQTPRDVKSDTLLGMEHRKPKAVSRKLDPDKQAAFIQAYENLLNQLGDDEAVLFGDAVHPTHAVRPMGCWVPKHVAVAVSQSSGQERLWARPCLSGCADWLISSLR